MKPRFPLSVTRNFIYRAKIRDTGELLECDDFKTLYRVTRSHLRGEIGCVDTEDYSFAGAILSFGYQTMYEVKPGYFYSEWEEITTIGWFFISSFSELFRRFSDGKDVSRTRGSV